MRYTVGIVTVCLLAGCAGSPPKPPEVKGEYRPININRVEAPASASRKPVSPRVFDFSFEGDIVASLDALRVVQPQLNVMPPLGKVSPLPVRVNLRGVTLEGALQAIGAQGGDVADVVLNTTGHQGGNQVFIRFRAMNQQSGDAVKVSPVSASN